MLARCSFKSAIEKSTKTMTDAQEKNHTVPIHLLPRTPLGQLMRRAVTYTHQAGADRSNAPLPSKKKILVIFGSPLVHRKGILHKVKSKSCLIQITRSLALTTCWYATAFLPQLPASVIGCQPLPRLNFCPYHPSCLSLTVPEHTLPA